MIASDRLKPAAAAKGIWTELGQLPDEPSVLLVGHDPHLSHLAAFLLEAPLVIDFKKAGLVRIDCSECTGPPRGVLKWIMTPKLARAL